MSSDDYDETISTEPSSTTVTGADDANPEAAMKKINYQENTGPKKRKKSFPIPCIILLEFILPICYVINSVTTQAVMGMINIVILAANVVITNLTKEKITGHKIILAIELIYNIILLGLASSIGKSDKTDTNIIRIIGLDFDNAVVKTPNLTIAVCVVAIVLEIVAAVLLVKTKPETLIKHRTNIFTSMAWIFLSDLIWTFCLAVMGAVLIFFDANMGYAFLPLLLYIVWISITMSLFGKPYVPKIILIIIYSYAILFSLFIFYQVSYLGQNYPIYRYTKSEAMDKYSGLSLTVNVVQIWFSTQLCFVFKRSGPAPKIPTFLVTLSDILLAFSFVAILVYSVFFPCYISVAWELIVFIACFFSLRVAKTVFFRILSIVHNVLFSIIYVTCLDLFYPFSKAVNLPYFRRLKETGLWHFDNIDDTVQKNQEFIFTILGFLLTSILAQIGRVVHFKEPKKEEEGDGVELRDIVDKPRKHKEPNAFFGFIIKIAKFIKNLVVFLFTNLSVAAVVILCITFGYQENQYCFNALWAIQLITNVLGLFHKPIFYLIMFITGAIIITATLFDQLEEKDYAKFREHFFKSGLITPAGKELPEYLWPYIIVLFLCVIITHQDKVKVTYPPTVVMFIFWGLAILHLAYLYVYGPNIFSVIYLLTGIFIFYSKVLNKILLTKIAIVVSGISVSVHLAILMLSEFPWTRNFFTSILGDNKWVTMNNIIDIRVPKTPDGEAALLAVTMFAISLTYMNTNPLTKKPNIWLQGIREEFKAALRSFFFYISWFLMFFFSISNDYPTVIKAVISLVFLLGSKMARFFNKMVGALLYTNTIYLAAEVFFDVFPNLTAKARTMCQYVGLYFVQYGKGQGDRNYSMTWQLLFVLVIIVNMIAENPEATDPKFDNSLGMRLYRAFYMMLHNFLPVFVNISLCVSTLFNPTIFGFFSFLVLVIVQFKPRVLQRGAVWISVLFNFCFLFQYLIWLGLPYSPYYIGPLDNEWGDFLSLRNIEVAALLTNMITAFMLTFYLQFRELAMNYDAGFNELPVFLKGVIKFIVANIFEIIEAVAIAISIFIPTIDGLFFFLLVSILFLNTLLFGFDSHKTISIHLWGLFFVIIGRLLSRIPYFISKGWGRWIAKGFGLPFREQSSTESIWIVLFALESLVIHIMETPMFQECRKDGIQRLAYRFIRVRQLKVINRLNQEICDTLQHRKIEEIFALADAQSASVARGKQAQVVMMAPPPQAKQEEQPKEQEPKDEAERQRLEEEEIRRQAEEAEKKKREEEEKKKAAEEARLKAEQEGAQPPEEEEEEPEPPKSLKERFLTIWTWIMDKIIYPIIGEAIDIFLRSVQLNNEAGVNVLTLNSVNSILRRQAAMLRTGGTYTPSKAEKDFLNKLPPSFYTQLGAIGEMLNWPEVKRENYFELSMRYISYLIRCLSLPMLVLICVIYTYMKPYLFAFLTTIYVFVVFVGTTIYAQPWTYRAFYILLIVILLLRSISTVTLIKEQIDIYKSSVAFAQSKISYPDFFGVDPDDTSSIEIALFLIGTWYVVDHLRNADVFTPHHYTTKIFGGDNKLDGYPDKYFYNFDNPERVLGLSTKAIPNIWQQITQNANNIRIPPSNAYFTVMIIDALAFLVMIFGVGTWTSPEEELGQTTSGLSLKFVFSLIFSMIFIFIFFLFRISNNFLNMYILNAVQLICVLVFDFWVCTDPTDAGLQLYLFLKYLAILIVFYDTRLGKIFANFSFPDIQNSGGKIKSLNRFMRVVPFIFEIHSLLVWMSRKTKVTYQHFFIQEDIKMLLENQMVDRAQPEENKLQKNVIIGGCFLLAIILLLFGPLFFMISGSTAYQANPVESVQLEIGLAAVGPLYKSFATLSPITTSMHNSLANTPYADINQVKSFSGDSLTIAEFKLPSQSRPDTVDRYITDHLKSSHPKIPYFKLKTVFKYPATAGKNNEINYQLNMPELTFNFSDALKDKITSWSTIGSYPNFTNIPILFLNPREDNPSSSDTYAKIGFRFDNTTNTTTILINEYPDISVLSSSTFFRVVIFSEEVQSSNAVGTIVSMGGGIIGIYILIIFTFGEVLRERTLGGYEGLWIERMRRPENLYQFIIAIEAFRAVGAIDKEYMMVEKMLDVLRSKEACIELTEDPEESEHSE